MLYARGNLKLNRYKDGGQLSRAIPQLNIKVDDELSLGC
jgi:hypothetical protein